MASVDNWRTRLNDLKIFKQLRENNSTDSKQKKKSYSKSLLKILDSDLYVWDGYASQLLNYDVKNLHTDSSEKKSRFQTLLCTDPPRYDIDSIEFNSTKSFLAVWGSSGVMVMEMPQRWGKYSEFEGGKPVVICKTTSVAEHYFASHKSVQVLHVAWHPGSETDSHLTILTSDNILSTYDLKEPDVPIHTVKLGDSVQELTDSSNKPSYRAALGEVAASFDFGPSVELRRKNRLHSTLVNPDVVWPAYIVYGNGDVNIVYTDVTPDPAGIKRLSTQGPLLMHPPAEDNYGFDACSIAVLDTNPPVLVMATRDGKLHHCLVMQADLKDTTLQSESHSESSTDMSLLYEAPEEESLYVYESVELELSLTTSSVETDEYIEDTFTCPIKIIKDSVAPDRYHCMHSAGVHTIVLPWIQEYHKYFTDDQTDRVPEQEDCIVEHLICTKPLPSSPVAPVLGLGLVKGLSVEPYLLTLTSDYELVSLPLCPSRYRDSGETLHSSENPEAIESPLRRLSREPFDIYIKKILQRNVTNPKIKFDKKTEISQQECFQLLTRTTQVFREEYLLKQEQAQQEIQKRVRILRNLRTQQEEDLENLQESRNKVRDMAENLATKYSDCQDKQEEILQRIEDMMRRLQERMPSMSEAERGMKRELETMEEQLEVYKRSLEQLKIKQDYQRRQIAQTPNRLLSSPILKPGQLKQIKDVLKQEGDDLGEMLQKVNALKLEAGV
ncbi:nucleoporin 88-like [Saccostrea echinata]|uniref:nucleoporin 88-like n=1 Tax=Saccostrea echinata TaxID=191078 RepID=UPI002A82ACC6|nr:nucleoporin 88-like [Saccostrea echinata]